MKIVGCMPLYDYDKKSYWMLPAYMKMIEEQNAVPIMLPLTDNKTELECFLDICGGFLLTGGHDVSPELYGETKKNTCGTPCLLRDSMEMYIIKAAIERNKSILGICRGIQILNVCLGGTLYQDLPTEYDSRTEHCMKPPYDREVHFVDIINDTLLSDILNRNRIGVNSYHHQAIKELSPHLKAAAISEDGLTEAVYMQDAKFILGVQWHPEFSYLKDDNSIKIVKSFVESIHN